MVTIMKNRFWLILGMYSLCLFMTLYSVPSSKASEMANTPESAPARKSTSESVVNLLKSGDEQAKKGDWELSLDTNKSAIEQSTSIRDKKLEALAYRGAAVACYHLGRLDEAMDFSEKTIEINRALRNAKGRSLDLILAGKISLARQNYPKALTQFEEAQRILPTSESSEAPGLMRDLAEVNIKLLRLPEATAILNRLGAYYSKNNDLDQAARIWAQEGDLCLMKGDYGNAAILLKKAEKTFSELKEDKELGQTLYRLAYLAFISGDFKQTKSYLDSAKQHVSADDEKWPVALQAAIKAMNSFDHGSSDQASKELAQAGVMLAQGQHILLKSRIQMLQAKVETELCNWKMADDCASTALQEFKKLSNLDGEAEAEQTLAQIYFRQSSLKEALDHSQRSFDIYRKLKNKDRTVDCRILIAEINEILGNPAVTLKQLKDALEESKSGIDPRTSNYLRLAVAKFRVTRENTEKALESALEAKKDFETANDQRGVAEADLVLGFAYELGGNIPKASESLQEALGISQKLGDRFAQGKELTALGVIYKNSGDLEKAQEIFLKAMELRKSIGDLRGYAANLANLANIYRRHSQNTEALQNLQKALNIYREVSDKKGEADALTNLGNLDAAGGSNQVAMEKFQKALQLHRETSDIRGIATDLISIASLRLARGEIDEGAAALKEAEIYNKRIYNPVGSLAILSETATVAKARKNYNEALDCLNKAMELAKKTKDSRAISSINLRIASVFEEKGNFQKALNILNQASDQLEKHQDYKGLSWALGARGIILAKMEDYEGALKDLNEATRIRAEHNITSSQSQEVDFYLAEIYQGFKDYDRALAHYHRALGGSQTAGTDRFVGKIYDRIGTIYYGMEEYSKARDFLEDALRISSESGNLNNQKVQLIRLADVMSKLKDPDNSLKYLQKALTLTRDTKDSSNEARVLTRMGTLNQVQGRLRTALENYSDAMDIRTKTGDKRGVNENVLQIALVNATMSDFDQSVSNIKRAIDIAQTSEDRSMLWKAYFIMGRTLEEKKAFGEALEAYRKALNIVDSMDADFSEESEDDDFIFGGTSALFETTLRVLMTLAKKDPDGAYDNQALRLIERLKAASFENTLLKINVPSFSNVPNDLIIKEKSLKLSLNKLNLKLMEQRSKIHPNAELMKRLLDERRKKETAFSNLREQLSKEYPSYVNLTKPKSMSIHQIQKDLDPDEVLLEYMVTRGRTYIFAVDKFRFHTFSVDYPLSEIEKDVELLVRPLQKHETLASWDPSVAYKLYSKIIKPVEYTMKGKKTVVVIPNGPLCWVPFEILVDSKSHENKRFWSANDQPTYLLEKYAFCYAESSYSLCLYRSKRPVKKPGWTLAAFGDPVFNDSNKSLEQNPGSHRLLSAMNTHQNTPDANYAFLKPLQATRKEIIEITKVLGGPTQTYLGPQATETLFKKADLSRYMYIHLGAYSVFWNGLGRSQRQPGIIFSLYGDKENDGFLELGEVFGLRLNADLVVISTTLTTGKNVNLASNGPFDLARGLIFAGADSVILSTWQISEDHAEKLLFEMYKDLKDGSKADALRKAKLAMLHSQGTSHPYYWGSFILVGDWRPRFLSANNRWEPENVGFKGVSTWRKLFNM
jgi:tetratricopeptide (TPR) repeat protein